MTKIKNLDGTIKDNENKRKQERGQDQHKMETQEQQVAGLNQGLQQARVMLGEHKQMFMNVAERENELELTLKGDMLAVKSDTEEKMRALEDSLKDLPLKVESLYESLDRQKEEIRRHNKIETDRILE